MLYTSLSFWIVAVATLFACIALSGRREQNVLLLAASLFIYGNGNWSNVPILLFSASLDFLTAPYTVANRRKPIRLLALFFSVSVNLALLCWFKYAYFFAHEVMPVIGVDSAASYFSDKMIFPLGISFYTFQAISYVIDCYRGKLKPVKSYVDYLLFITFFPQLVAGPIEKASHFLPQVMRGRQFDAKLLSPGLTLIAVGLFRKFYIADSLAAPIDNITQDTNAVGPEVFLISWLMAVRVYFDFYAYSEIGRGIAKLFGIELTINFKPIWSATNPMQFWERWNITTGRWFRDYVLIPLGGNGSSRFSMAFNMFFMFVLIGFWHGASWSWLAWGAFQGLIVAAYRDLRKHHPRLLQATPIWIGFLFIQLVVLAGGGFFHVSNAFTSLPEAFAALTRGWDQWQGAGRILIYCLPFLVPGIIMDHVPLRLRQVFDHPQLMWFVRPIAFGVLLGAALFLSRGPASTSFIYFAF